MGLYAILYTLKRKPATVYAKLTHAIEASPDVCHASESCWFIATSWSASQIYTHLQPLIFKDDMLMVLQINPADYSVTLNTSALEWLRRHSGPAPGGPPSSV